MGPIPDFRGEQIAPTDGRYDEARSVFNAMVDRRPALIARCAGPDDVARAIAYARREGLPLAVRAGGHSVAGLSLNDGGVVVDVRPMADVTVDAQRRIARCGAGATWGEFDRRTQAFGLATTGGRISTTGVAGLTLGGGSGWLERRYGLTCDNLEAIELVTAAGEIVRASEDENADLFWAMHGGGGNFGVVTAFEFRLHEVGPMIYGGVALFDPADGVTVARAFRDFHSPGPEEAGLALAYLAAPPEPFVPEEWQGRVMPGIAGMWVGPPEEGEAALRELLGVARPIVNVFGELPYVELQSMIDDPPGKRNWWTAEYLAELPDAAVEAFCAFSEAMPASFTQSLLVPWGGAVASGEAASPLMTRDAAWVVHPFCVWEGEERDEEHISWGRRGREAMGPWATGGTYLNFIGDEGPDRVRAAFGPAYDRLAAVKAAWDPENLFHGNQNIVPAAVGTA
jgi:FAD/FMN-containing dehydrogenase